MEKIFYDISDLRKDCRKIFSEFKNFQELEPDAIVGLARGGAVPATFIAYLFNKPLLTITIQTYDYMKKKENIDWDEIYTDINNFIMVNRLKRRKILIIDDIVDTGETMNYLKRFFGNKEKNYVKFASLFISESTPEKFYPDFYLHIKPKNSWIIFPWENF